MEFENSSGPRLLIHGDPGLSVFLISLRLECWSGVLALFATSVAV